MNLLKVCFTRGGRKFYRVDRKNGLLRQDNHLSAGVNISYAISSDINCRFPEAFINREEKSLRAMLLVRQKIHIGL